MSHTQNNHCIDDDDDIDPSIDIDDLDDDGEEPTTDHPSIYNKSGSDSIDDNDLDASKTTTMTNNPSIDNDDLDKGYNVSHTKQPSH